MKAVKFILIATVLLSCDALNEDKGEKDALPIVTAENFEVTIAENPAQGQLIGTIVHSYNDATSNRGFELISSDDPNSLSNGYLEIDRESGEVTISSPGFFDFEQITTATGNAILIGFNSSDQTDTAFFTITVNLTDVNEEG